MEKISRLTTKLFCRKHESTVLAGEDKVASHCSPYLRFPYFSIDRSGWVTKPAFSSVSNSGRYSKSLINTYSTINNEYQREGKKIYEYVNNKKLQIIKLLQRRITSVARIYRLPISTSYTFTSNVVALDNDSILEAAMNTYTGMTRLIRKFVKVEAKPEILRRLRHETNILLQLDSPYVHRITEIWEDESQLYIVSDISNEQSLENWVTSQPAALTSLPLREHTTKYIICQVLHALAYLHAQNIYYRNLSMSSIFVSRMSRFMFRGTMVEIPIIRLHGFAISIPVANLGIPIHAVCGSLRYSAPEMLLGNYDQSADIWSVGVLAYELITSRVLFAGSDVEVAAKILAYQGTAFDLCSYMPMSAAARAFLSSSICQEPNDRKSAISLLHSDWIVNINLYPKLNIMTSSVWVGLSREMVTKRLERAANMTPLEYLVRLLIARTLPGQCIPSFIPQLFYKFDVHNVSVINVVVMRKFLERTLSDMTDTQMQELISYLTLYGDSSISYSTFIACLIDIQTDFEEIYVSQAFGQLALGKNGVLSADDIKKRFPSLGQVQPIQQVIKMLEKPITYDKFITSLVCRNEPPRL